MAYITATKAGYRVQIERKGVRMSQTFATKAAAKAWATREEAAILDGNASKWPRKTVGQALDRYEEEVTSSKKTAKSEALRLRAFRREFPDIAAMVISEVQSSDIARWRDTMLKRMSPGSVKRTANSIRNVWTIARKEWRWCGESPWPNVKMPADNPERDRLAGWREIRAVLRRCDYVTHHPPVSGLQNVAWAFLVALRTGMRASEIVGLQRQNVTGSVVTVAHKTQHLTGKPRSVPLMPRGRALLAALVDHAEARSRDNLFTIKPSSLDAQFRKITASLLIKNLHFHDSRATALTHLARRLDVMTLAKISGHRDIRILQNTYYRETAEQIAERIGRPRSPRP
jgi:integrase